MGKKWVITDIDQSVVAGNAETADINIPLAELLFRRGIRTPSTITSFLNPRLSSMHSPFLMKNMDRAVQRLRIAIDSNEKIGIFADSDLDGMTSLTVLYSMLNKMGVAVYYRFIKNNETYGMTEEIINEFAEQGITLLITVDSGIRDVNEIALARSSGIDVIVTDHHEPDVILPDAIILNPKQKDCLYPFKELAGVGVTFKLCHAFLYSYLPGYDMHFVLIHYKQKNFNIKIIKNGIMIDEVALLVPEQIPPFLSEYAENSLFLYHCSEDETGDVEKLLSGYPLKKFSEFFAATVSANNHSNITTDAAALMGSINGMYAVFSDIHLTSSTKLFSFLYTSLGFISIGTIADVVPLTDENRVLVKHGIASLNRTAHPGLTVLINARNITSKTIAWEIAPLLNTPGRFGLTELTEQFFLPTGNSKIEKIIQQIKDLNEKRKTMVNDIFKNELAQVENGNESYNNFIFTKSDIPDGIAGLIALRLSENKKKPSIVVSTQSETGVYKGSGRCSGDFDFFSVVEPLSGYFERIGGHAQAFGFTINYHNINDAMKRIDEALVEHDMHEQELAIDFEIHISSIKQELINQLALLEPFGKANEEPLILSKNVRLSQFSRFGLENNHGRAAVEENPDISLVGWRIADGMEEIFISNRSIDVVYSLEAREFNNKKYIQLIIIDYRLHEPQSF
ncbi:MAG TPA: single-stranded-DNA-specific exonuclease RecJ [Spirochaetota bacterium]|nr:single-stranded-DNA-specific exonuclease RecJ [Spirochaetota bacterium]HPI89983.1 single-stranded-DNA-specific exonuclease RecJ [Spirochaetota bacterium]HPR48418.1 single-stranded-DNA-specific exonuclease RecJ [Spirochaetota bacterium]